MRTARSVISVPSSEAPCGLEYAREAVSKITGILDVEANHVNEMLIVEYDQERVTLDQIRRTIKEACEGVDSKLYWT